MSSGSHDISAMNANDGAGEAENVYNQTAEICHDFVETNFRYLTIGSPGPCTDTAKNCTDSHYDADVDPDSGDEDSSTRKKQRKIFFGHDFRSHKSPDQKVSSRKKKSKDTPAIKVDKCETQTLGSQDGDDILSDSSGAGSSTGNIDGSLHSPPRGQFFLSPTPPMCRKVHVDSKTVIYYSPSLTCSRSEGCIRETIQNEDCSPQNEATGITAAHSLGILK